MHTKAGFHITAAIFEGEGATILPIAGKWVRVITTITEYCFVALVAILRKPARNSKINISINFA